MILDLEMSLESDLIDSAQFDSICSASVDQKRNGSSYKFPLQTPSDVAEIEENQLNVSKSNHLIIVNKSFFLFCVLMDVLKINSEI